MRLILLLYGLRAVLAATTWYPRGAPWKPRASMQASYNESIAVLIGGRTSDGDAADVWRHEGSTWRLAVEAAPFGARHGGTSVMTTSHVFLAGGVSTQGGFSQLKNDVWRSDMDAKNWTQVVAVAPWTARTGACGSVFQNRLWLLGGLDFAPTQDVFASSGPMGDQWTKQPPAVWAPRGFAACAVYQGRLMLFGGTDLTQAFSDLWSSADGTSWTDITPASASLGARASPTLLPAFGWLYLMGGTPAGEAVWATADGREWMEVDASTPWSGVKDAPVVRLGSQFALLGGVEALPGGGARFSQSEFVTTPAFFCDQGGVVCSGHGRCSSFQDGLQAAGAGAGGSGGPGQRGMAAGDAAGRRPGEAENGGDGMGPAASDGLPGPVPRGAAASVGASGEVGASFPQGFHCDCSEGWAPPDCSKEVCSPINCVHGRCVPKTHDLGGAASNASSLGAVPLVCLCDGGWLPPTCVVPQCREGCSREHGSCDVPGRCDCAVSWRGDLCDRPETVFERLGAWVRAHTAPVYGVVTSLSMAAAVAYGCACNVVLRGPSAAEGATLLAKGARRGGKGARRSFAPRPGGYGTMTPAAPSSGWDDRGLVPEDGFTPARDTRAPLAAATGEESMTGEQLLAGQRQRQDRYASVAGVSLAPIGSPARPAEARRPLSVLSGAGSDGSSALGAPMGRGMGGRRGRGDGRRESNPFGL